MEYVKLLWVVVFFFSLLILIFVWAKILIIGRRLERIRVVLTKLETLSEELSATDSKQK